MEKAYGTMRIVLKVEAALMQLQNQRMEPGPAM